MFNFKIDCFVNKIKKKRLSVISKPIEYSLNVYLTWVKLIKNSNEIQNYGNLFATSKNLLVSSLPPGFRLIIDSQSFDIMHKY